MWWNVIADAPLGLDDIDINENKNLLLCVHT